MYKKKCSSSPKLGSGGRLRSRSESQLGEQLAVPVEDPQDKVRRIRAC